MPIAVDAIGGRLADMGGDRALGGIAIVIVLITLRWPSHRLIPVEWNWFIWGVVTFAPIPVSQVSDGDDFVAVIAKTDPNEQESVTLLPELDALEHVRSKYLG